MNLKITVERDGEVLLCLKDLETVESYSDIAEDDKGILRNRTVFTFYGPEVRHPTKGELETYGLKI